MNADSNVPYFTNWLTNLAISGGVWVKGFKLSDPGICTRIGYPAQRHHQVTPCHEVPLEYSTFLSNIQTQTVKCREARRRDESPSDLRCPAQRSLGPTKFRCYL